MFLTLRYVTTGAVYHRHVKLSMFCTPKISAGCLYKKIVSSEVLVVTMEIARQDRQEVRSGQARPDRCNHFFLPQTILCT